tara:strand:+ start:1581 stop:3161 length:1581 start_codon:yes stop_codon:yes gene_type:complete
VENPKIPISELAPDETTKKKLLQKLAVQSLVKSKDNFLAFVKTFAPKLVADFKMGRHIEVISEKLQKVEEGELKRLMVFLPPRSSKSVICSKLFPAWYLGRHPQHEILSVSHSDTLASDFGRSVRDLVGSGLYQNVFRGVKLRSDVRAAGKWQTNQNGVYVAAGVRTQIAGRGAHIALLDDVMSEEDAFSETGRRYIKEWYPAGLRTRLMPNGSIVIINTRYHEDDICGWLLACENDAKGDGASTIPWDVLRIPAWVDESSSRLLNIPVGESYFPEWKPKEVLKNDEMEIRRHNGSRYWESLYMQNPVPDEGGIFKKSWFNIWKEEEPPHCDFIIQTMDTAFSTRTTADYSVIQTWGIFTQIEKDSTGKEHNVGHLILLGNIRDRLEYPELRSTAQDSFEEHQPDLIVIEKKASGQSLIQDLRRAGLPILEYTPDRDKVTRAYAASPLLEAGRVWLPNKVWAQTMFDEAVSFPNAAHDDQVDSMVMAVLYLKESWHLQHPYDPNYNSEDENIYKKNKATYWNIDNI